MNRVDEEFENWSSLGRQAFAVFGLSESHGSEVAGHYAAELNDAEVPAVTATG